MKKWLITITIVIIIGLISIGVVYVLASRSLEVGDDTAARKKFDTTDLVPFENWVEKRIQIFPKKEVLQEISLLAVGDIMLSRKVGQQMVKYQDYHYPFFKVMELIEGADLSFGNLESPIQKGSPVYTGSFLFRADPEVAESLSWTGFDVLSLANNHVLNQGTDGLLKTFGYLSTQEIDYCGAMKNSENLSAQLAIKEVKGIKIGFLCYAYGPDYYAATKQNPGMILMNDEQLKLDLESAKPQVDLVIVSMHDGVEYNHTSSVHQQNFAHLAIDNGADLIIGHHPHVVQEVEIYKDKYIFYSLGNFVFDQMWSQATREGLAVKLTLTKQGVQNVEYFPVVSENYSQPRHANEVEREKILKYLGKVNLNF
ncbi:CapA family protein [Candidatus Kuenenbacteria bacterium]|nr:CapA family protein [Candidatus Kuenenbacteria bacterium]